MENNEIMVNEEEYLDNEVEIVEAEPEETGIGVGKVIAIAAGVGALVAVGVKVGKKIAAKIKEKKALRKPVEGTVVEPSEEQIVEVATEEE